MAKLNKQQALRRLTSLEEEAKQLRLILEAPDSILPAGTYLHGVQMYDMPGNRYNDEPLARALSTLVYLRTMAGTSAPKGVITERSVAGEVQCCIEPKFSSDIGVWQVKVMKYSGAGTKLARISPSFNTEHEAFAAINTIGEGSLLNMFFTLHGFVPAVGY